jgi:dethiobiotin synthetase
VSPHIAATQAGVSIELELIKQGYDRLCTEADYAIVEGVGGWLAPLSNDYSVADLARAIGLPVVIVVGIRLGCLNHARLTRQAIDTSGVSLAGWVANCFEAEISAIDEQIAYLTQALAMPPLAIMGRHQANIAINSLPGLAI